MAKELTKKENNSLQNLEQNMESKLNEYKKEWSLKSKEELKEELFRLSEYLNGCYKSEIDDTLTNIRFHEGKVQILKELIKN